MSEFMACLDTHACRRVDDPLSALQSIIACDERPASCGWVDPPAYLRSLAQTYAVGYTIRKVNLDPLSALVITDIIRCRERV